MPIPGLKVLDEIIAGLPDNSRQRLMITELKAQIAILEQENLKLKQELEKLRPTHDLPVDAGKFLMTFFKEDEALSAEMLAERYRMEISVAKYHCDVLLAKKLITYAPIFLDDTDTAYEITEQGRAFVVERGLV